MAHFACPGIGWKALFFCPEYRSGHKYNTQGRHSLIKIYRQVKVLLVFMEVIGSNPMQQPRESDRIAQTYISCPMEWVVKH
jgi:hypothetical protein